MGGAKRKGFSHRSVSSPARNGGDNNGDMRLVNNMAAERQERELLVLWRHPLTTLEYFVREVSVIVHSSARGLLKHRVSMFVGLVGVACLLAATNTAGPHTAVVNRLRAVLLWCLYWLGLGVLSSVGLGTGLHTFLLYLGPHIAAVTLAAYECGSLNFPEPPYPDDIICPETIDTRWSAGVWNIMRKVMLEAMMWGAGTALGELPPYFMARAARLSGYDPDDEDELREFEELQIKKQKPELMTYLDRAKIIVERLVKRVGFLGILVCASIPNPLFDLAGITCGHFLVPFWTFFGATLIGKAVIKMMLQEVFVIVAFSDVLIARAMDVMGRIPAVGPKLQAPLQTFLVRQKERLHRRADTRISSDNTLLAKAFEVFVIAMIVYFVISIVNSLAQSYHKRLHKKQKVKKHSND